MTNVFISYSSKDEKIAKWIYSISTMAGIQTFLSDISISLGAKGNDVILNNLREAKWVFYIASKNSNDSHAVQQELGGAWVQGKEIIPIMIDIEPNELPGWMSIFQGVNYRKYPERIMDKIKEIAETIKNEKFWPGVTIGIIICLILLAVFSKK